MHEAARWGLPPVWEAVNGSVGRHTEGFGQPIRTGAVWRSLPASAAAAPRWGGGRI